MTAFSIFLVGLLVLTLGVEVDAPWLVRAGGGMIAVASVLAGLC